VQISLYRIAQEALNNVFKHSKASEAVVTLRMGDTVRLTVALRAPSAPGTYFSYWMLRDSYGVQFGTEACGCVPFWAKIIVSGGATATP